MKFLVDMPLSPGLARWLADQGHESHHASARGFAHWSDERILAVALTEKRIVVTADLDYPRLLAEMALTAPAVILLRGGAISEKDAIEFLRRVLMTMPPATLQQSLVVVDRRRVRFRRLPLREPS